jgi:hypothetical protein
MRNLGVAIAGGHGNEDGARLLSTPPEAVIALLDVEDEYMPRVIWEPCCGVKAIANVLTKHGRAVGCTDLHDYGVGAIIQDFLKAPTGHFLGGIVTNPPFPLARQFIEIAVARCDYVAMLLKQTYYNAGKRVAFFHQHKPTMIYPMAFRLDFTGGGNPTMDCMWVVWDKKRGPLARFQPLENPCS